MGDSRRINSAAAARPTLAYAAGRPVAPTSMPWPATTASVRLVALLEFAFLVGVQIVTHVGWDDDLDADQALGLGPSDQSPRCRAGNAEPGRDLGLGEAVEVVERRRAQGEPQVFGGGCAVLRRRHGLASDRPGDLAVRRRNGHLGAPFPA